MADAQHTACQGLATGERAGGPTVTSPTAAAVVVTLVAASGPVAMWLAGFQVALWLVVPLAVCLGALFASPLGRFGIGRFSALLVAAVLLSAVTGTVVGAWLALGAVFGDWVLVGRPLARGLPALPKRAALPALLLLAPGWLLPNDLYRNIPVTMATALALVLVAGTSGLRQRRWLAAGGAVAAHGAVALVVDDGLNAAPSLLLLGAATCTVALVGWAAQDGSVWSLTRQIGSLAAATPAMIWAMVNVGIWVSGVGPADSVGYRAWLEGVSRLGTNLHEVLAATAVPSYLLGLLAVGTHITLEGRFGVRTIATAAAAAVVAAAVVGWLWTVQFDLGVAG